MKNIIFIISLLLVSKNVMGQLSPYTIRNLEINTEYSDFGVTYYDDANVIFSSSKRKLSSWDNMPSHYLNLYKGKIDSTGTINETGEFLRHLDTRYNESNGVFTKDRKTLYFSGNQYFKGKFTKDSYGMGNAKLFKAVVNVKGKVVNIQSLPFNNDAYSIGHPTLNEDETFLYFTSDMPGGFGLTDIYKIKINSDGTYGDPINLGAKVNTSQKEMFPYVYGNTLYFSSEGHNSVGGLDIYKLENLSEETNFPINLGVPFNSKNDDFCFVLKQVDGQKEFGYFSSNRPGGKGDDDIYYFERKRDTILGVKNLEDAIQINNDKIEDQISQVEQNSEKKEFIKDGDKISQVEQNSEKKEFIKDRDKIIINTIYFDLNSSQLRIDAIAELNKIVALMNKYPKLRIVCSSHTDSRASEKYNLWLSDRRVKNTAAYIVSKGIIENRLFFKGYGESELVNNCSDGIKCTEAEHQLNRRTEFVILNKEAVSLE